MKNTHKLTEGALLLAIFSVLLLITIYIPVLGVFVNLFLAVPFIMFSAKNDRKSSIVFLVGGIFISFIIGTVLAIPLAISYGLTGVVLGDFIRERKSRATGYIAGSLMFLVTLVIQYIVAIVLFKMDIIKETIQMFEASVNQSIDMLTALGQTPDPRIMEQLQMGIEMLEVLIPSLFVFSSFILVLIIELVSFPIVKRFGVTIPAWSPFKDLQLPKSLLWYYLLVLLASLLFSPEPGTYWYMALINLAFILQFFMVLQGLSLVYFFSHEKGVPRFVPITVTILIFFFSILLYIVRILGIIDLGFDLKKRLSQKK